MATRLGEALRLYLAAKQIEQLKVALAIGTSQSTVTRFLQGKNMPDAATMARLVVWLLDDDEHRGM